MAVIPSLWRDGNPDLLVHLLLRQNAPPLLGPRPTRQKNLAKLAQSKGLGLLGLPTGRPRNRNHLRKSTLEKIALQF